jgi:hypothetical protein
MSKAVVYNCDVCGRKEQVNVLPAEWTEMTLNIASPFRYIGRTTFHLCDLCTLNIKEPEFLLIRNMVKS